MLCCRELLFRLSRVTMSLTRTAPIASCSRRSVFRQRLTTRIFSVQLYLDYSL